MKWKRATWPGTVCQTCDEPVRVGQEIGRWGGQWQHRACVEAQQGVAAILSGQTYRGTPPRYRRRRPRDRG